MKKLSLFLLLPAILFSCTTEEQPEVNKAPSQPQLVGPANDLFCTTNVQTFEWQQATDPEGDDILYILEISEDVEFKDLFFTGETAGISKLVNLEKGQNLYWRVAAKDAHGNKSDFSGSRSLYTEAEATSNFLPAAPVAVSPEEGAEIEGTTTTLTWTAEDADGDQLSFDLYFGKSSDPHLLEADLQTHSKQVDLEPNSSYYWKVVVKDEHGGKTDGQIWSFKTK